MIVLLYFLNFSDSEDQKTVIIAGRLATLIYVIDRTTKKKQQHRYNGIQFFIDFNIMYYLYSKLISIK